MDETEEQRKARETREADQAAKTMFNVFPQGTLQSVGRAIQRVFSNPQGATMMAGAAGVNPLIAANVPEFPKLGPLVRTDYGLPPSERPDWRNLADQWDAKPVNVAPPPTQFVGANPRAATADDIAFFYRRGQYAPADQAQQVAATVPQVTPQRSGVQTAYGMVYPTVGGRDRYGNSLDQTSAVQRLAEMPKMGARRAAVRETIVNPQSVKSAIKSIESGKGPESLAGLTQAEKIEVMRNRGAAIGQRIGGQQEAYFTQKRAEMAELNRATAQAAQAGMSPQSIREARSVYTSQQPSSIGGIQQQFASFLNTPSFGETPMANRTAFVRAPFGIPSGGPQPAQMQTMAAAPQFGGGNTTQRSWDDYVGPNPIESRVGTPFYDKSPRYGRRA